MTEREEYEAILKKAENDVARVYEKHAPALARLTLEMKALKEQASAIHTKIGEEVLKAYQAAGTFRPAKCVQTVAAEGGDWIAHKDCAGYCRVEDAALKPDSGTS